MKRLSLVLAFLASPVFATDPQFGAIRIEAAPNITHAFVSGKSQGDDATKVSKNEWNAAHVSPVILIASVPTGFVWPAQPAAVTEFCGASTSWRWRANLTNYSTVRLTAQVISAGAASAALRLQYTTDTTGATGWDYLDGVSGPSVTVNATGVTVSATVSIATAAKTDVLLRLIGINGDGAGGSACYSTIKASTATLADSATTATTATTATALGSNGSNCSAGSAAQGVDAAGNAEGCFAVPSGTGTVSGTNTGDQSTITGNAGTATALAANGANCSAGNYPLGVDASGAAEGCTAASDSIPRCVSSTGSDAFACTASPSISTYTVGQLLTFKASDVGNTGPSTIAFNGLAALPIVLTRGGSTNIATVTGDLRAGVWYSGYYDGTNFQCINCLGMFAYLNANNTFFGGTVVMSSTLRATGAIQMLHIGGQGSAPTVSACGTSPSTVTGFDTQGSLTTGSGGTVQSCTLTFAAAWASAPSCYVVSETSIVLIRPTTTTTTLVFDTAVAGTLASQVIKYGCLGS